MNNRQRILIIDDSPLSVRILVNMLEKEYDVIWAYSGADGYKLALEKNPDIIILDIIMSGMNGYELCKMLKSNDLTMDIPVIFISALGEMEDERTGLEIGAIDYITKPFSEPIVKVRIKNHLELKRNRDILSALSLLDGLTGLYNRRHFNNKIEQEWRKAIIRDNYLSLILIDIDHFKLYNDNYGHLKGDECLKTVANCIKNCFEDDNKGVVIARFGGEEFVCVMPDTDFESAVAMSNKILQCIPEQNIPFEHSDVSDVVTVSIGLGCIKPTESLLLTNFIKSVDDALYKSKHNGRNQIQYANI